MFTPIRYVVAVLVATVAMATLGSCVAGAATVTESKAVTTPKDPKSMTADASQVWFFGDSISTGQGLADPSRDSWVAQLSRRAGVTPVNFAKPGYALSGYLGNVSDELATAYASGEPIPRVAVVDAGSNDLGIHDSKSIVATELAAIAVRDSLLAHGVQTVIFCAVIPRGDGYDALRQQFNLWLALEFGADYQGVDLFFHPYFPAKYYQADRLHPNVTGATLLSQSFDVSLLSSARAVVRHI